MAILKIDKIRKTKSFIPNDMQRRIIYTNSKHTLASGGVGAGKTVAAVYKVLLMSRMFPNNLILVGRQNFPALRDTTMETFKQFLAELGWSYEYKVAQQNFILANKSTIMFRYLDGFQARQGLELGAFMIDQAEEVKEQVYQVLMTRLRRQIKPVDVEIEPQFRDVISGYSHSWLRSTIMTCNPDSTDHWLYKQFVVNEMRRQIDHPQHNPRFYLVEAATSVNKQNLPPDYLETLKDMSPHMISRYVDGEWGGVSGQIYADLWNDELHMIDSATAFPPEAEFYRFYDHGGMADAGCCLFAYFSPSPHDGELECVIFDLYWGEKQTISQHARNIMKLWQDLDFKMSLADPQVKHRTQQSTTKEENISMLDVYRDNGLYLTPAFRPVFAGIDKVRVWMHVNKNHPHRFLKGPDGKPLMGAPHLYIHKHLWRLIEQIKSGHYSEKKPGALAQTVDDARTAMRFGLASPISYRGAEVVDKKIFRDPLEAAIDAEFEDLDSGVSSEHTDPYFLPTD